MAGLKQTIIRGGLESLYFTGAHWALKPVVGGIGAILTLHHVRPPRPGRFQPNRILEVTPRFLTRVVKLLGRSGIDVISLDEMYRRMAERDFGRRFVCLTFDDGYRDNLEYAYPILREAGFPFAVYVPTSFPDRLGELWWRGCARARARVSCASSCAILRCAIRSTSPPSARICA
jgi:peptidoglycan/xylan/chitin deacetylase (PgdA/CDA1 family)